MCPLRGRKVWTPARAARKGGSRGEFRAARAIRFRQGSLGSGFALFPKLTTRQEIAKALNISLEDLII